MATIDVKFKKLDKNAVIPTYAHEGDVCMDMTAISVEYDKEKDLYIYHTGLAVESPLGIGQFLFPRSSNRNTDAYLCNSVGVVDSALYRGEIMFCYKNRTSTKDLVMGEAITNAIDGSSTFEGFKTNLIDILKNNTQNIEAIALEHAPYKVGERVGQMLFAKVATTAIEEVSELSETERGEGGFGSTGK